MFVFIPPLHLREKIVIEEGSPCISRQESTRQGLWRNRIPHMTQRLMIIFLQSFLFPLFLLLLSLDLVSLDSPRVYSPPSSPSSFDHSADLTSVNEIDKFFLPCYPTWASSSEGRRRQSLLRKQCKNILGSSLSKSDKETNIKKEGNWSLLHKKQSHSCHKKRRETRSRESCAVVVFSASDRDWESLISPLVKVNDSRGLLLVVFAFDLFLLMFCWRSWLFWLMMHQSIMHFTRYLRLPMTCSYFWKKEEEEDGASLRMWVRASDLFLTSSGYFLHEMQDVGWIKWW